MAQEYWVKREGKMYGPYSGGRLKKLASEGKISPSDQISADKKSWQLAELIRGLSFHAGEKPQQVAAVPSAPPPLEVAPRTGTASRTHDQQTSSSKYEQRFPPRPSHTRRIAIVAVGVALVGLVVAIIVWLWTPPGESMASEELAQSNENVRGAVPSSGKSGGTRTTPSPTTRRAGSKPPVMHKKPPRIAAKPPDSQKAFPPISTSPPKKNALQGKKAVSARVPDPPKVKVLTPVQAVAADLCRVTSQQYLKAGLPVAGLTFGSSLQEIMKHNGWRLGKRTKGSQDSGKLLTPDTHDNWSRPDSAKRFCWYRNEEDFTKVEHSRFTLLLFDNGKLRGIHRSYNYMWDKGYEYEKKHVREVFQIFGTAQKENTKTGRTPTGQSFISMIHWFPNSVVFIVYTQNQNLALWIFDRKWLKKELALHLEEYHSLLLLSKKITKARPGFSPANGKSPASVLPTAKDFKREVMNPNHRGPFWIVKYAPSDNPRRTPSLELLVPSTLDQMQTKDPISRTLNWKITFDTYSGEKELGWALSSTAVGRAGLLDIAFQKLFLRHYPVVTKLEDKNYRTKDGFVANWWNCELYYLPPSKPDPSRGL